MAAVVVMTGRIVKSADFERVLRQAPRAKSEHFAIHHLGASPGRFMPKNPHPSLPVHEPMPVSAELSTSCEPVSRPPVDDSGEAGSIERWLGTVVPKRHAKRSVTRSLMKRQMHAAFDRESVRTADWPTGLWVLRLRSSFDVKRYPSAASDALRAAVREELDVMLSGLSKRLIQRVPRGEAPVVTGSST